jgi:hypothetical protein
MATEIFKKTMAKSFVKPEVFFGVLFHSRDCMHLTHLQTTSYAEHKALNKYYEGILDLTDNLIETYFGIAGKRVSIKIPQSEFINAQAHLKQLYSYIESNRGIFEESQLQNIVDEICALINKTQYLLTLS